ncbi:nuclease-related domain-containing protein [Sporosarcina sp. FSL K6-3457]|uniref:nuclease-related domain-containing protein n=1 Tax=Sporosarcina sp. FSL K6-3457 TaxID=2978204 RepID=UPI0030F60487
MLYKKRKMPNKLKGLISLDKRLPNDHEKRHYISEELYNRKAGYGGEQQYDKCMTEFKPAYPHAILHDVCLKQDGVYFQMDSILITPAFIAISEVKNIAGKIIITSNPTQFIRVLPSGERKVLKSPIVELERKQFFLFNWLKQRSITLPITGVVVFAYNNELVIEQIPETKILFAYEAPSYFRTLPINKDSLTNKDIQNLAFELIKNHQEYTPFPMAITTNIQPAKIKPGVICPQCTQFSMIWEMKKWTCLHCKHTGIHEHKAAIEDWFILINNKLTNREFRYFTQIEDRNVARRLLAKSDLVLQGNRNTAYYARKKDQSPT